MYSIILIFLFSQCVPKKLTCIIFVHTQFGLTKKFLLSDSAFLSTIGDIPAEYEGIEGNNCDKGKKGTIGNRALSELRITIIFANQCPPL